MDAIETLKGIDLFNDLEQEELETLAKACRAASYEEGDVVFQEGDEGSSMCIVAEGSVKMTKTISQGVDKDLLVAKKGMVFGEISFIDRQVRSANAVAATECKVITISRDEFMEAAEGTPLFAKIWVKLAATIADRLRLANDLLKETLIWGLEAAGGAALNLDKIISDSVNVKIDLVDGKDVSGKILKVEESAAGYEITVKSDDDKLIIIPYHAITRVYF